MADNIIITVSILVRFLRMIEINADGGDGKSRHRNELKHISF